MVVEGTIYCFGINYLWKLDAGVFVIVTKLDTRIASGGADYHRGQLYFKGSGDIRAIGSPDPQLPAARYRPYSGTGTSITALKWIQNNKLWYADNNNLYEFKTGADTSLTWLSRRVSFGQEEEVVEVRIYLAAALASGDQVDVKIYNEAGTATTVLTFDFTTYGAIIDLVLHAHNLTNAIAHLSSMQVGVTFTAGAARVKDVIVQTKPVRQK